MLHSRSILNNGTNYNYVDTFISSFDDPNKTKSSADLCRAFFIASPKWIKNLMALRNKIVAIFGLKTDESSINNKGKSNDLIIEDFTFSPGESIGIFKIYEITPREVILGQDDKHLDFRVSLFLDHDELNTEKSEIKQRSISISTVVTFNNWFGKLYFMPVKPFHRKIVPLMLNATIKQLENN